MRRIVKCFETNESGLIQNWLENPSINLTESLAQVIKAFQNPIWAEQARERLKQSKLLTKVAGN